MGLLNIIRRMALREKQSIREISRRTGLSRNTIAKYLNAGTIEPTFTVPERPSKLDPFADKLRAWLKTEAGKSRKQRRTLKQVHADLVALGFTGSYGRVAAFAREWRADRQREQQTTGRGIFVPLSFRPGEAFQFDWREDYAVIGGERVKLQRWRTSNYRTAGRFSCGRICSRHTRCSLTPIGTAFVCSAACLRGEFMTICALQSIASAAARSGR